MPPRLPSYSGGNYGDMRGHAERIARQQAFLTYQIDADPRSQYATETELAALAQQKALINFAALHRGY